MIVSILGAPGSGKGTQAQLLGKKLGGKVLSLGQILRDLEKGGQLPLDAARTMHEGKLVPDEFADQVIEQQLSGLVSESSIIIDGFPRDMSQLDVIDRVLAKSKRKIDLAFLLVISAETSLTRIARRGRKSGRADDIGDTVRTRLDEYQKHSPEVISDLRSRGVLREIDGEQSIEAIHREILRHLGRNQ